MELLIAVILIVIIGFSLMMFILSRYRKCPSDKIMVIYGKVGNNEDGTRASAKTLHGGAAFVWPVLQAYAYLDLTPISISVDLTNALSRQNIRVDVPSRFTIGVSTELGVMQNAAERLLGLSQNEIQELAKDIIFGQLRLVIATMDIEEINTDRDKLLDAVSSNVETELKKIGLRLINVNLTDVNDESGYIQALGQEAASKAVNDAKVSVAEANRGGAIGEANAQRDQRIHVADANSKAIEGENLAKAKVAASEAELREKEAEYLRRAVSAEKVQSAKTLLESYVSEKEAEIERANRDKATFEADILIRAEVEKTQKLLAAQSDADAKRYAAQIEADALYMMLQAEAKGLQDKITAQANGFKAIVDAAGGNAEAAAKLIIADNLENIIRVQVDAIKNIEIDKITVWDSGAGKDGGNGTTSDFITSLFKSVPPMTDLYNMVGLELPKIFGRKMENGGEINIEDIKNEILNISGDKDTKVETIK